MDTLIELIVRGLIALFSRSSEQKLPPPRSVPRIPPIATNPPANQRSRSVPLTRRPQQGARPQLNRPPMNRPPMNRPPPIRPQLNRQEAMRRLAGKAQSPPPIPRPFAAAPPMPPAARPTARAPEPAPAAVTTSRSTISAAAIRQLMLSRRTAMRTIYALAEVVGPPVGLR